VPVGPVKQYTEEPSVEPITIVVYPGADGASTWYEDDGHSFNYRRGESMRVSMTWRDATRRLSIALAPGSRMLAPLSRRMDVRVAGATKTTPVTFTGRSITVAV
jgi:Alpha-glucosidases, family 31 of glycosyl hydrolases